MSERTNVPAELLSTWVQAYERGATAAEIARAHPGHSSRLVIGRLRLAGVEIRPRAPRRIEMDATILRDLVARGLPTRLIAHEMGVSAEKARDEMVRLGIQRQPVGAPRGERNPAWNGGRTIDKSGYVLVRHPTHAEANRAGYVREHRMVMEASIGRPLLAKEVVHHRDGDRANNALSNLQLYASNAEHLRDELTGRQPQISPEGRERIREAARRPRARRSEPIAPPR